MIQFGWPDQHDAVRAALQRQMRRLHRVNPLLATLTYGIADLICHEMSLPCVTVTSIYRPKRSSPHAYYRAVDVSTDPGITQRETELLTTAARLLNGMYMYDALRLRFKVAVFGDERHKDHMHIQTHPRTMLKPGKRGRGILAL